MSVTLAALESLPEPELADKIVMDTNSYYPERDGQLAVLDRRSAVSFDRHTPAYGQPYITEGDYDSPRGAAGGGAARTNSMLDTVP